MRRVIISASLAAQLLGAGAILVGLGMLYIPAAILAGGAGLFLWGAGYDDNRKDDS